MLREDSFRLFNNNVLKKGCKVKMNNIKGCKEFKEIEDAFIKKARPGELEDDWVIVVIDGQEYDSAWIDDVKN